MPSNRIPVVLAQVAVAAGIAALGIQGYLIARGGQANVVAITVTLLVVLGASRRLKLSRAATP